VDYRVYSDTRESKDPLESLEHPEFLEQQDHRVTLVRKVTKENSERLATRVHKDRWDPSDQQDPVAYVVTKVEQVNQEALVPLDYRAKQVHVELRDLREPPEQPVDKDSKVYKVMSDLKENKEHLVYPDLQVLLENLEPLVPTEMLDFTDQ
jgi:hypothetical protein